MCVTQRTINVRESEFLHVEVKLRGVLFNVIGVYNHNLSNIRNCLEELKVVLENELCNAYMVGDFNLDMSLDTREALFLGSYMESLGYLLCNRLPTRMGRNRNSLIDHFYTNDYSNDLKIINVEKNEDLNMDHNFLIISIKFRGRLESHAKETSSKYCLNIKKLAHYLETNKCDSTCVDVDEYYVNFLNYFQRGIELSSTSKNLSVKKNNFSSPWIDKEYQDLLAKKEYFYKLWKKHKGNGRIEQDYKACRNGLLSMKRRKRKAYYSNILEKTDNISKDIWKVAKEVLYNKCKTKASHESVMNIYVNGVEAAAEETPGVFNNYFTSVVGQMLVGKKIILKAM